VNLCQKLLFLHQLTHNMRTDCSLNYKFNTWKFQAQTWGEHVVNKNCFWHSEQFLYTTFSPHVLQKEELLAKIYLYFALLCYTLVYFALLCSTLLYFAKLCYTFLYFAILCYTLLYFAILSALCSLKVNKVILLYFVIFCHTLLYFAC
jgi:hypothetical protein